MHWNCTTSMYVIYQETYLEETAWILLTYNTCGAMLSTSFPHYFNVFFMWKQHNPFYEGNLCKKFWNPSIQRSLRCSMQYFLEGLFQYKTFMSPLFMPRWISEASTKLHKRGWFIIIFPFYFHWFDVCWVTRLNQLELQVVTCVLVVRYAPYIERTLLWDNA
jgi:hypothetical protein